MKNDKHKTAIPETVITQVHDHITAAIQLLKPYTVTLTPHERQTMLKMGDKSLAFVEKTHDYAVDNPGLVPSYVDMAEFETDYRDARGLWGLFGLSTQLNESIDDTITAAGSDSFHSSLSIYNNVHAAAKDGVPGAQVVYDALKPRFPGGKRRRAPEDHTPADE